MIVICGINTSFKAGYQNTYKQTIKQTETLFFSQEVFVAILCLYKWKPKCYHFLNRLMHTKNWLYTFMCPQHRKKIRFNIFSKGRTFKIYILWLIKRFELWDMVILSIFVMKKRNINIIDVFLSNPLYNYNAQCTDIFNYIWHLLTVPTNE